MADLDGWQFARDGEADALAQAGAAVMKGHGCPAFPGLNNRPRQLGEVGDMEHIVLPFIIPDVP
jgi:hypothetical protein